MGAFSYYRFIVLFACIDCWKIYNRLISACTVKAGIEVQPICVLTSERQHFLSGFFGFNWLFCSRAPQLLVVL